MSPRQPLLELLSLHQIVAAAHMYSLCNEIYGYPLLLDAIIWTPYRYAGINHINSLPVNTCFFANKYTFFYCIYGTFHSRLNSINTSFSVTQFLANMQTAGLVFAPPWNRHQWPLLLRKLTRDWPKWPLISNGRLANRGLTSLLHSWHRMEAMNMIYQGRYPAGLLLHC